MDTPEEKRTERPALNIEGEPETTDLVGSNATFQTLEGKVGEIASALKETISPVDEGRAAPAKITKFGKVWHFKHETRGMIYGRLPTEEEKNKLGFAMATFSSHEMLMVGKHESEEIVVLCDENGRLILSLEELHD